MIFYNEKNEKIKISLNVFYDLAATALSYGWKPGISANFDSDGRLFDFGLFRTIVLQHCFLREDQRDFLMSSSELRYLKQ